MALDASTAPNDFENVLVSIDLERRAISRGLDPASRDALGQFLTPSAVAQQLAAMIGPCGNEVRILDPGAGIGALGAALVVHLLTTREPPNCIALHAYEVAEPMWSGLDRTMQALHGICGEAGVIFTSEVHHEDFLTCGVDRLDENLFSTPAERYDAAILNPPYRKIGSSSPERSLCQRIGLETTNLYTAFLAVTAGLLREGGQMAAIVPRSFTNGTYFRPFREWFSRSMVFDRIHVFESRRRAFADDGVLQENILLAATRSRTRPDHVTVTSSADPADPNPTYRQVPYDQLVSDDHGHVIHLVSDELNHEVAARVASLPFELADLGLTVSTGRVVDFRATQYLRGEPDTRTVPLIYPGHLREGRVRWPMTSGRKPNALIEEARSADLLVPEGLYVLTKGYCQELWIGRWRSRGGLRSSRSIWVASPKVA
jgi:adenine-specific DNA-methyltransferase